jgi:hypothetical protein
VTSLGSLACRYMLIRQTQMFSANPHLLTTLIDLYVDVGTTKQNSMKNLIEKVIIHTERMNEHARPVVKQKKPEPVRLVVFWSRG